MTKRQDPNDYDGCWDITGVDPNLVDPILLDCTWEGCKKQKLKYRGEMLAKGFKAENGQLIEDYFKTKPTEKGVIYIALQSFELEL